MMANRDRKLPPLPWSGERNGEARDPAREKEARQLMLTLLGNSALILTVYFVLNQLEFWPIFFIYMGISAVLIIIYVIYNKGFAYRDVTADMLPDTMTPEQKAAILQDAKDRLRRSRWMLTLILPFVVAFMLDALYLFVLSDLFAALGILQA
jgi:hypothetical protein